MKVERLYERALINKVSEFYKERREGLIQKYDWKINTDNLPFSSSKLNGKNLFENNLKLKRLLNKEFDNSSRNSEKMAIAIYYIYYWGGIHSNSSVKLEYYATADIQEIISLGKKGIASWSKALTARNCEKYAIFDARVSVSLNGIIYKEFGKSGYYFPLLSSRNETVKSFYGDIRRLIGREQFLPSNTFYKFYIDIVHSVAKECHTTISEIEMCLFAFAEEVAQNTFKKK